MRPTEPAGFTALAPDLPGLLAGSAAEAAEYVRPKLVWFLPWLQRLTVAFGTGELAVALAVDEPPLAVAALMTIGFAFVLVAARALAARGSAQLATQIIAGALNTIAVVGSITVAGVAAPMAMLPVLSFSIRLPYLRGRHAIVALVLTAVASTLVLIASRLARPTPMREPFQDIYAPAILLAIAGLLMAALLDFSTSAVTSRTSLRGALEVQQTMRSDRADVARLLSSLKRLGPGATPEEIGDEISRALVTIPGITFGVVLERHGVGLRVLGISAPPGLPLRAGDHLPDSRAHRLITASSGGPWAESVAGIGPDQRQVLGTIGLRALAYAPIHWGDAIIGVVEIGTNDRATAAHLLDDLPAVGEVAAAAGALLGASVADRRALADARRSISDVIAKRAFMSVFQPIVTNPGREIVAYEALTRFANGVPPDRQFREAARVGLQTELELATIAGAIRAGNLIRPKDRWLAINVSAPLLDNSARLAKLLRSSRHPIVLELTEHEPIADYERLRQQLSSIGVPVRVAVDDAGAGYASMKHVVELRPSLVKLDISLVRGIDADAARQALVAGMCFFAERVDCRLLAEGVETEAELTTLAALGVPLAQGFLLGRPRPASGS